MAKKMYGRKTIERLRNGGYSHKAIEDITFIAQKFKAKVGKVEKMLSEGYSAAQVAEIYDAARKNELPLNAVQLFYDTFKPEGGQLLAKIHYAFHNAPAINHWDVKILNGISNLGKKNGTSLEQTMETLNTAVETSRELDADDDLREIAISEGKLCR